MPAVERDIRRDLVIDLASIQHSSVNRWAGDSWRLDILNPDFHITPWTVNDLASDRACVNSAC